ncbi:MAG: arsenate reductase ArsC [Prolixibacteraceae bacterium]|nr:arsenate reductase ArsC [Burkholderiales bacterium]
MESMIYNVLFLCTHNSARSIMAEAILNNLAVNKGRFKAFSAGSQPADQVNYFAFEQIRSAGLPAIGLQTKSWQEFAAPDAPRMHFVFTVGETAAGEVCPTFAGNPITAHWDLADPAAVEGDEAQKRRAFSRAFIYLYNRINIFASLPLEKLDRIGLQRRLDDIGTSGS